MTPKFKIGHVTAAMPIRGTVCYPKANTSHGKQCTQFEVSSFSYSRDILGRGGAKI